MKRKHFDLIYLIFLLEFNAGLFHWFPAISPLGINTFLLLTTIPNFVSELAFKGERF